VVRAPGRVNLLGGHTDYNEGFVLPAAVNRYLYVTASSRADARFRVWSAALRREARFSAVQDDVQDVPPWSRYIFGVAVELVREGRAPRGADLMLWGDLPVGGGLSSSAAVEVATAWSLMLLAGKEPVAEDVAVLGRRVEHVYAGVRCGIMDQMTVALARESAAMLLDCRSRRRRYVGLGPLVLVVCHTGKQRALADSGYNRRREECEEAVHRLAMWRPAIASLRDVCPEDLPEVERRLPQSLARRVRHVVLESARVLEAAEMLGDGDYEQFGCRVTDSHRSLRDLYEVSCPELDLLVEIAGEVKEVFGCRLTGAGFGGAVVAVATPDGARELAEEIQRVYPSRTGLEPTVYVCRAAGGAGRISVAEAGEAWTAVGAE
jgi:galactokinase